MKHAGLHGAGCRVKKVSGFTLIELLLSISIFTIVLLTTTSLLNVSLRQLRLGEARMSQFQQARVAFDSMIRQIAGCELNPYYDFVYPNNDLTKVPTKFALQSDMQFVLGPCRQGSYPLFGDGNRPTHGVFFHGAFGLTDNTAWKTLGNLVNSWGYYIEFGSDSDERATFLNSTKPVVAPRYRFRLKELQVSTETMKTYAMDFSKVTDFNQAFAWFRDLANAKPSAGRTIAENIVALVITPEWILANGQFNERNSTNYYYDTRAFQYAPGLGQTWLDEMRNRLPPTLRITMVSLDEVSAQKLQDAYQSSVPDLGLANLFTSTGKYRDDLTTLQQTLNAKKLNYRTFTTFVRLRNSRWTGTN